MTIWRCLPTFRILNKEERSGGKVLCLLLLGPQAEVSGRPKALELECMALDWGPGREPFSLHLSPPLPLTTVP